MFDHISCMYMVSPLCGSSGVSFGHLCSSQEYGFSPVWILMWLFRQPEWVNVLSHLLQGYGFSLVGILMCLFRWLDRENILLHSLQGYGFYAVDPYVILKVARFRKCFVTFLARIWFSPLCGSSCVSLGDHIEKTCYHIPCRDMVSLLCGSLCDSLSCQLGKMFCHIPCRHKVSPLCGSSSDSSDCQIENMFCHIPCIEMVSPLCGSSCVSLGDQIEKTCFHIPCRDMFSLLCGSFVFLPDCHFVTNHYHYPLLPPLLHFMYLRETQENVLRGPDWRT